MVTWFASKSAYQIKVSKPMKTYHIKEKKKEKQNNTTHPHPPNPHLSEYSVFLPTGKDDQKVRPNGKFQWGISI